MENIMTTVVGVFRTQAEAQAAIDELRLIGIEKSQFGVASKHAELVGAYSKDLAAENAATGAATGAAVGISAGTLWGLGIVAGLLPAIGPVIAGGTLAAVVASAATGAAACGLAGALVGLGLTDDDAAWYEKEFGHGRVIVSVDSDRPSEVQAVLSKHGAYERPKQMTSI
jgi:hypothetical protein